MNLATSVTVMYDPKNVTLSLLSPQVVDMCFVEKVACGSRVGAQEVEDRFS